jgi:N4-(beta-N-acetylglucosaminyl)-L-asparaginase
MITRRNFIAGCSLSALALGAGCRTGKPYSVKSLSTEQRPLVVSTWPFGKPANDKALSIVQSGGGGLDAIVEGIGVAESDLTNSSVGAGGLPNANGVVQLDSCIMSGPGHQAGGVAAIEGIEHPIAVARKVMEKTPHVLIVGAGAKQFALSEGFHETDLLTESSQKSWEEWNQKKNSETGHDTIAMLILMPDGNLYGGCSTSGLAWKLPGRVGDSPIIGGGLYVDNEVGAAGATGVGENVMRYCATYQIVEYMRLGASPTEACIETILRIARKDPKGIDLAINFVALDKRGNYGAAGVGKGFDYAVAFPGYSEVLHSEALSSKENKVIGGHVVD